MILNLLNPWEKETGQKGLENHLQGLKVALSKFTTIELTENDKILLENSPNNSAGFQIA